MGPHPVSTGRPQRRLMFMCNHFEGIVDGGLINAKVKIAPTCLGLWRKGKQGKETREEVVSSTLLCNRESNPA